MKTTFSTLMSLGLLFSCTLLAESTEAQTPENQDVEKIIYDATDAARIAKEVDKKITVEGTVIETFWVRNSVLLITFVEQKDGFVAVSFKQHRKALDTAFNGDIVATLKGKKIQVSGTVTEYEYRPQIVVESPDQITVMD